MISLLLPGRESDALLPEPICLIPKAQRLVPGASPIGINDQLCELSALKLDRFQSVDELQFVHCDTLSVDVSLYTDNAVEFNA
jgi:hypothetical protein